MYHFIKNELLHSSKQGNKPKKRRPRPRCFRAAKVTVNLRRTENNMKLTELNCSFLKQDGALLGWQLFTTGRVQDRRVEYNNTVCSIYLSYHQKPDNARLLFRLWLRMLRKCPHYPTSRLILPLHRERGLSHRCSPVLWALFTFSRREFVPQPEKVRNCCSLL